MIDRLRSALEIASERVPDPPAPWIYVAARKQGSARALADALRAQGAVVCARWLDLDLGSGDADLTYHQRRQVAQDCLEDVATCDVVVLVNPEAGLETRSGGCHVEVGYALALHKPVVVLGCFSNVFHYLDQVALAAGPKSVMSAVRKLLPQQQAKLLDLGRAARRRRREARRMRKLQD